MENVVWLSVAKGKEMGFGKCIAVRKSQGYLISLF